MDDKIIESYIKLVELSKKTIEWYLKSRNFKVFEANEYFLNGTISEFLLSNLNNNALREQHDYEYFFARGYKDGKPYIVKSSYKPWLGYVNKIHVSVIIQIINKLFGTPNFLNSKDLSTNLSGFSEKKGVCSRLLIKLLKDIESDETPNMNDLLNEWKDEPMSYSDNYGEYIDDEKTNTCVIS